MTCGMLAASASAPRLTCTRIWIGIGCLAIHWASGTMLPSSSRGFFASGSSSSSSSSPGCGAVMPGGLGTPGAGVAGGVIVGGGASEACGSLELIVEIPVIGPTPAFGAGNPKPPKLGSAGAAPEPEDEVRAGLFVMVEEDPDVSWAVGGTIVCAGPASAPASRAAASAPASAASLICSSIEPNKSGLFATKPAKFASTSSANADSFLARSTRASFWCFHFGSSNKIFKWLDISSAGIS
mmetsp:Transcript_46738/g.117721  ORF Transcript_46738/g.117721 Transcript_46738/m.117721 type:complete len:239 (-) Transcript_46738:1316-2032(-)